MEINTHEIENVSKLKPFERYKYFIKRLADNETFYILKNSDDEIVVSKLEENKLLPLWNFKEFAELCLVNNWKGLKIHKENLDYFEEELIDLISTNEYLINVFPVKDKTGFIVSLNEFIRDLKYELDNY